MTDNRETSITDIPANFTTTVDPNSHSGYLFKKTRDGRWQKRWFETNGVYLTYYKSKKMEKLLAALSLPQVGEIKLVGADTSDTENKDSYLFSLELNTRVYTLKAKTEVEAGTWVTVLKKLQSEGSTASNPMSSSAMRGKASLQAAENGRVSHTDWKKTERWRIFFGSICPCC